MKTNVLSAELFDSLVPPRFLNLTMILSRYKDAEYENISPT